VYELTILVSLGAGGDEFFDKVLDAIDNDKERVIIEMVGEYGHLTVDALIRKDEQ